MDDCFSESKINSKHSLVSEIKLLPQKGTRKEHEIITKYRKRHTSEKIKAAIGISRCNLYSDLQSFAQTIGSCSSTMLPGYGIIVAQAGQIIFQQVYGTADLVNGTSMTNNTIMAMGGNTNGLTSFLLSQLYDQGVLSFDTPITTYLSSFQLSDSYASSSSTLRDLLTHHIGISRNDYLILINNTVTESAYLSSIKNMPFVGSFRYDAQYSNWMYAIAKYVIQSITGNTYEYQLQNQLFGPLNMLNSYPTCSSVLANEPNNYAYPSAVSLATGSPVTVPVYPRNINTIFDPVINSAGGAHMSINDIAKYLKALSTKTIPSLSQTSFQSATSQTLRSVSKDRIGDYVDQFGFYFSQYSYGFLNGQYQGQTFFGHNGRTIGQSSFIITYPDYNISISFVTNQFGYQILPMFLMANYIFDLIRGSNNYYVGPSNFCNYAAVNTLPSPSSCTSLSTNVLLTVKYIGTYQNNVYGTLTVSLYSLTELTLQIGILNGRLRGQSGDNFVWCNENTMFVDIFNVQFGTILGTLATTVSINFDSTVSPYVFTRTL